jgi:Domain of unknown function (DUF4386)
MSGSGHIPRYLGAVFLVVVLTSGVSGALTNAATGSGSISEVLSKVADHSGLVRFANLVGLANAVGILVLAALLYAVLHRQGQAVAFAAALCWVGESLFYAFNQVASSALARVASDYQSTGGVRGPNATLDQSLGQCLLNEVYQRGGMILMFFYCAGGLLFYSLLFNSAMVPRWISGYGLVAVAVGLVGASIELLGHRLGLAPYIAIGPFEIIIGLNLLIRGAGTRADSADSPVGELVAG